MAFFSPPGRWIGELSASDRPSSSVSVMGHWKCLWLMEEPYWAVREPAAAQQERLSGGYMPTDVRGSAGLDTNRGRRGQKKEDGNLPGFEPLAILKWSLFSHCLSSYRSIQTSVLSIARLQKFSHLCLLGCSSAILISKIMNVWEYWKWSVW